MLLDIGEQEGWVTAHASSARIITPYENEMVMMHGAPPAAARASFCRTSCAARTAASFWAWIW